MKPGVPGPRRQTWHEVYGLTWSLFLGFGVLKAFGCFVVGPGKSGSVTENGTWQFKRSDSNRWEQLKSRIDFGARGIDDSYGIIGLFWFHSFVSSLFLSCFVAGLSSGDPTETTWMPLTGDSKIGGCSWFSAGSPRYPKKATPGTLKRMAPYFCLVICNSNCWLSLKLGSGNGKPASPLF